MNKVYIFGAGKRGIALLKLIDNLSIAHVVSFIDNNVQKTTVEGKNVLDIEEAIREGALNELVIISPLNYQDIEDQLKEYGFKNVFCWSKFIPHPKYCIPAIQEVPYYKEVRPFNYYESPYPDISEMYKWEKDGLFDQNKAVLDIDLNVSGQLALIEKMEELNLPRWETGKGYRHNYGNGWFEKGSGDALCYMMQIVKPKNIIEIGSGYSTAVMLDTNESYFNNEINIISVDPRADRLKSLLKTTDNLKILEKDIQEITVDFFDLLKENDILFIDSSHVSKIGSDVNYILFEILPRLNNGVYIHFHDMFFPFIYPRDWVYNGNAYNELYLLRAFLMNNKDYSVQLFGDMLQKQHVKVNKKLDGCGVGSLWLKKNIG